MISTYHLPSPANSKSRMTLQIPKHVVLVQGLHNIPHENSILLPGMYMPEACALNHM